MAVMHNFQNPICMAAFCCSLQCAFSPLCTWPQCVAGRDIVNSHLYKYLYLHTVKFKTMLLDFLYLPISNI